MNSAAIRQDVSGRDPETVIVLEREVLVRSSLAAYLRSCGYRVLEARNAPEATTLLQESSEPIRFVLSDAENGFRLSGWVKAGGAVRTRPAPQAAIRPAAGLFSRSRQIWPTASTDDSCLLSA
jgi:hypothetical protein